jgi:hypothetical protein
MKQIWLNGGWDRWTKKYTVSEPCHSRTFHQGAGIRNQLNNMILSKIKYDYSNLMISSRTSCKSKFACNLNSTSSENPITMIEEILSLCWSNVCLPFRNYRVFRATAPRPWPGPVSP